MPIPSLRERRREADIFASNPEPTRAAQRGRYASNPEPTRAAQRGKYASNPVPKKTAQRVRYNSKPERKKAAASKQYAKYRSIILHRPKNSIFFCCAQTSS